MGLDNLFSRRTAAPQDGQNERPVSQKAAYVKEMLSLIKSDQAPLNALASIGREIEGLEPGDERVQLEQSYDEKAAELWRGQLSGDRTAIPNTIEGTAPVMPNDLPSARYSKTFEELKVFRFFNPQLQAQIASEFEQRLHTLAGE